MVADILNHMQCPGPCVLRKSAIWTHVRFGRPAETLRDIISSGPSSPDFRSPGSVPFPGVCGGFATQGSRLDQGIVRDRVLFPNTLLLYLVKWNRIIGL